MEKTLEEKLWTVISVSGFFFAVTATIILFIYGIQIINLIASWPTGIGFIVILIMQIIQLIMIWSKK